MPSRGGGGQEAKQPPSAAGRGAPGRRGGGARRSLEGSFCRTYSPFFSSLFTQRSGWFIRQQQEEASQGQLSKSLPPPTPPAFSFQFNDQTSAWKKGGGAGGTEGSPRRRCCVCMSGTGGHPSPLPLPPAGPVPPLPSDRAPAAREGRGGERRRRRRQRGSRECQCSVRLLARTHCGEVGEGGRCVPFPPVPFLTLTSRGQSPAERNKGKWGGKPTPAAAAPETPREAEPSGSR